LYKIGDFGQTKSDILDEIFLVSLLINSAHTWAVWLVHLCVVPVVPAASTRLLQVSNHSVHDQQQPPFTFQHTAETCTVASGELSKPHFCISVLSLHGTLHKW